MFWIVVGALCLFAVLLGTLAGFWNFYSNFVFYWAYQGQRTYTNVIATENPLTKLDAGALHFAKNTFLDKAKAVGYQDGSTYCVSPIVDSNDQTRIGYWAVGVNCCGKRGTFTCADADDSQARQGLVLLNPDPSFLESNDLGIYRKAAKESAASNGLIVEEDALFMSWVTNTNQAIDDYFSDGVGFLLGACGVYLGLALILGCTLHFGSRPPKGKEARRM